MESDESRIPGECYDLGMAGSVYRAVFVLGVCAPTVLPQMAQLPYRPIDAEYSSALDRIVMVSSNPNRLHVYDAGNGANFSVDLPKPPTSVSVGPSGLFAAVGHDALISYVNLMTMTVERTYPVTLFIPDVILAANYVHSLFGLSVNLQSGAVVSGPVSVGYKGRLHPSGNLIYSTYGGSPEDIITFDVSGGPLTFLGDSPYHGEYSICPPFTISSDGRRLYTGCGTVFHAFSNPATPVAYLASFIGTRRFAALAESGAARKAAAIQGDDGFPPLQFDNEVRVYETEYLTQTGRFLIPDFVTGNGTFRAHGKWIFFNNAGTSLYIVAQADVSSGLLLDHALHTIDLANPPPCAVDVSTTSAAAIAEGGLATVNITTNAGCSYRATASVTWLQPVSGGYGSGSGLLTYLVRPNLSASPRTGSISVGGRTVTVTQSGASTTAPPLHQLAYSVADAEFSTASGRIVFVTTTPDELHQYDPTTRSDTITPLIRPPLSVGVRADGRYAAVGHNGWISYVNLQSGVVERVVEFGGSGSDISLDANYLYIASRNIRQGGYESVEMYSISVLTNVSTFMGSPAGGGSVRSHPGGSLLYFLDRSHALRYSTAAGPANFSGQFGNSPVCGNLWFSEPGDRAFTACGTVHRSSGSVIEDGQSIGAFAGVAGLKWAAHSASLRSTVVIPSPSDPGGTEDSILRVFGDGVLGAAGQLSLPAFSIGSTNVTAHGRFVFWDPPRGRFVVLARADASAGLLSDHGVAVFSPGGCSVSLGGTANTIPVNGGAGSVGVTAPPGCIWQSSSNASWLSASAGGLGFGTSAVDYTAAPNPGPTRTGIITIAGQPFSVTQPGAAGSVTIAPLQVAIPRPGGTSSVTVSTIPGNVQWSVTNNAAWISVTSAPSGTGNSVIQYSVAANNGAPRTGALTIGGQTLTIWQAGTVSGRPRASPGVFRSGFFWLQDMDGDTRFSTPPDRAFAFGGLAGDVPVTGDWNGDGRTEVGVYRSINGTFLLDLDGDSQFTSADKVVDLGIGRQTGDVPVIGDWNGDGLSKTGIFRQGFLWILDTNGDGVFTSGSDRASAFGGIAGDVPVTGDWFGDGKTNIGLFRLGFYWILDMNGNGVIDNVNSTSQFGDTAFPFGGLSGDVPIVGKWNAFNSRSLVGIFRAGFFWVLDADGDYRFSEARPGQDQAFAFGGIPGDKPVIGQW